MSSDDDDDDEKESGNIIGGTREGAVVVNINEEIKHEQQKETTHNHKFIEKQASLLSYSVPFLQKVPAYVISQVKGSTVTAATLRLLSGLDHDVCSGKHDVFVRTLSSESDFQSFVIEFIITFYLIFVISGVATDNKAIGELAGLAIGSTMLINPIIAGPVSGASMNPGRSLGPAIVYNCYIGIWIYTASPILGAVAGAWVYNTVRYTHKPLREITKSGSFLKTTRNGSSR
ncbi:unnamed protein product [Eruca vesicaria subsp. sativa]|uniref:Uncharacterized protein n=1 Tax=Eruca vesicaria subsp. sativa TaxID=29727 RepID=A0ABC8LJ32_ERUVS|nr:unnamed protein product [Eruca vesicaria subsp. sativa]